MIEEDNITDLVCKIVLALQVISIGTLLIDQDIKL